MPIQPITELTDSIETFEQAATARKKLIPIMQVPETDSYESFDPAQLDLLPVIEEGNNGNISKNFQKKLITERNS